MFYDYLDLVRPKHWIKNFFVFAAVLFSLNLFNIEFLVKSIQTFIAFCLVSSFVYIINDTLDAEKDQQHPVKKNRPIASGRIPVKKAVILAAVCLILSITLAYWVNINTLLVIIAYVVLNLLYNYKFKDLVILDVIFIACGFVLRVLAGATAVDIVLSNWILFTTLCISLFLGFGKRRNEILLLDKDSEHRPVLKEYGVQLLDYMMVACVALTIMTYALYTIDISVIQRFQTDKLIFTVPFVIYGLFRYMYLVYQHNDGGDPADIVLGDKNIIIVVLLWLLTVIALIYGNSFISPYGYLG